MKWMEDLVEAWHCGEGTDQPLHEALGMSPELYARWVEKPPQWVIGIDEVGYGALAGPLVIGAVAAPARWDHPLLKDSKKFTGGDGKAERGRASVLAELAACNQRMPEARYYLHRTHWEEVDRLGVYQARIKAFGEIASVALSMIPAGTALVVIDGDVRANGLEHVCLPKADGFVPQVSAASILAKVSRDTEMRGFDAIYPEYKFGKHKGYGSPEHQEAILAHGLCPIHRKSYRMKFLKGEKDSSPSLP